MKPYRPCDEKIEHYWEDVMLVMLEMGQDPWCNPPHDDSLVSEYFYSIDSVKYQKFKKHIYLMYRVKTSFDERIWRLAERVRLGIEE
tara:strand:+ start:483 stop:743 length:261 start_codon:yes stop_codon:yes gene_type:complete